MIASFNGHADVVCLLLEAHAHVNQCKRVLHMFKRQLVPLVPLLLTDVSICDAV